MVNYKDEFDYYLLRWTDANVFPPVIGDNFDLTYLEKARKVENPGIAKLRFAVDPKSSARMGDYHPVMPVFSVKVSKAIMSLELDYIQLVPAVVRGIGDELFDYYFWNICRMIRCLDFEKSDCKRTSTGGASNLNTIVLDQKKLEEYPLNDRLVFILREAMSNIIFHKNIVEKIMATEPSGLRFIKLEDYYDGMEF